MWIPKTWTDIQLALGTLNESEALDFKQELSPGKGISDIAKDAAAMSLQGGVIVIGVSEDNGLASSITPVPLKDVVDRLRQVLDSRVSPSLWVDFEVLRENPDDSEGVVVITIPPSWSAPHQVDRRFPARSGATTRWLNETELETLFLRRASLQREADTQQGLADHDTPPGIRLEHLDEVGVLRLGLRPVVAVRHSEEPRLRRSLTEATSEAREQVGAFVGRFEPKTFDFLGRWEPAGPYGWKAGRFTATAEQIRGHGIVGAMYRYQRGFSVTTQISLRSSLEEDVTPSIPMAEEHHWAIELVAQLALGGGFYLSIPEASLLRVDLDLGGLLGAVSHHASRGMAFDSSAPTVSENLYAAGGVFAAHDLAVDPRSAVRELLDPFMVAILDEGVDIIDLIGSA